MARGPTWGPRNTRGAAAPFAQRRFVCARFVLAAVAMARVPGGLCGVASHAVPRTGGGFGGGFRARHGRRPPGLTWPRRRVRRGRRRARRGGARLGLNRGYGLAAPAPRDQHDGGERDQELYEQLPDHLAPFSRARQKARQTSRRRTRCPNPPTDPSRPRYIS